MAGGSSGTQVALSADAGMHASSPRSSRLASEKIPSVQETWSGELTVIVYPLAMAKSLALKGGKNRRNTNNTTVWGAVREGKEGTV